jgi:hypothetical protein
MGWAANMIIQLIVMSRKLPLKTAWSPLKSVENFIENYLVGDYLNSA